MLLFDVISYAGTNLFAQGASFVAGFLVRYMLPPQVMGVWNVALVIRTNLQELSLGVQNAALRELSMANGRDDIRAEGRCRDVTLVATIGEAVIVAVCLIGYAFVVDVSASMRGALFATSMVLVAARLADAYVVFFQGAQLYTHLSGALLIGSVCTAVSLPLGALLGGLQGLFVGAVVGEALRAFAIARTARSRGLSASLGWDGAVWKRMVSYGVFYRLAGYPNTLFMTMDMLWVTSFLGIREAALYGLAKSCSGQVSDVTARMGTAMYSRVLAQYGGGVEQTAIAAQMLRFTRFQLLVTVPIVSCAAASVIPFLIVQLIPLYLASAGLITTLLIGSFFVSQNNHLFAVWIAQRRLIAYGASNVAGVVTVGSALAIISSATGGATMASIAAAAVIGQIGSFAYMTSTAGKELWGMRTSIRVFLEVAIGAGWVWLLMRLLIPDVSVTGSLAQNLKSAIVSAVELQLAILPLVLYGLAITGGGSYIRNSLSARVGVATS